MMTRDSEPERTDEELAILAAASPDSAEGKRAACAVLARYVGPVYRWCRGYARDRDSAEDLAQEVLLRAYVRMGDFEGWGSFSAWIFTITRNLCRDAVRKSARRNCAGEASADLRDPRPGPDAVFNQRTAEEELLELIRRHLSELEQEAIWLRCVEKMPVDAVTQALGIGQASGARGVLQSARRKLRAALAGRECSLLKEECDD